jgi:hypothetical protein
VIVIYINRGLCLEAFSLALHCINRNIVVIQKVVKIIHNIVVFVSTCLIAISFSSFIFI